LSNAFSKISRVGSLTGGTKWYLSNDCLLAAKRTLYSVEYRRFYLHDLQCILVWPSRSWWSRLIIPAVLLAALGGSLWLWVDSTTGEIFVGIAFSWVLLELALGPTAKSRVRTTGISVDIPLVKRTRRAHKVLAKIDAAVRATRGMVEQPSAAAVSSPEQREVHTTPEAAAVSAAAATQTNGS